MDLQELPVSSLKPNDYNFNELPEGVLKGLTAEVKRRGFIMHHITARKVDGEFVIIDGEHQWRAAQAAGLATVPVQVVEANTAEAIAETYRRNGLRGEANRVKLSRALRRMQTETTDEDGKPLSNVKAGRLIGRTEAWVRTTHDYGTLAELAQGREGYPGQADIAKLTEKDVKAWLAYAEGSGPNPNGDYDDYESPDGRAGGGGEQQPQEDLTAEDKARKAIEGIIKRLAKMTTEDRAFIAKAIKRFDREAEKAAAATAAAAAKKAEDEPGLPL